MKRIISWLLVFLLACSVTAEAQDAVVDGKNATKVHLRSKRSTSSDSKGLYFTGTNVICEEDPVGEWVHVMIGSESGYMKAEYLLTGYQPSTSATGKLGKTKEKLQLQAAPFDYAKQSAILDKGTMLTILGETSRHWYYVQAEGKYGYVPVDKIANVKTTSDMLPFAQETNWSFLSGAGAWSTGLTIQRDGTFTGVYSDSEMGDTDKLYPNGTQYSCVFYGKFSIKGKEKDGSYSLSVASLDYERPAGETQYVNGVREISSHSYGISKGNQFALYMTGAAASKISEEARSWIRDNITDGKITCPVLVNLTSGTAFAIQ